MNKIFIDNLKKITALLLAGTMTMSLCTSAFAQEEVIQDVNEQNEIIRDDTIIEEDTLSYETEDENNNELMVEDTLSDEEDGISNEPVEVGTFGEEDEISSELVEEDTTNDEKETEVCNEQIEEDNIEEENIELSGELMSDNISGEDEEAREIESMPSSPDYLKKFLTYLSLKYPEIGIEPKYGTGVNPDITDEDADLKNWYNSTKMARQTVYDEIIIDGTDTFDDYPNLTKNMVQFRYLGCFGNSIGVDDQGQNVYSDTVKTLIIRNVDEIRNLYVPASVETLIIENTTFNCYYWENDSPGFQCGILPGDLQYCENLKKLVLKNVKFGDNYKNPEPARSDLGFCDYETNFVLNLQNCHELEELEIDVSFEDAREVQLAINGGTENLFEKLENDKCKINPAPGTGYDQVKLYANENSKLAKLYNSSEAVKFKNGVFRLWLIEALGIDTNHDGVVSQAEMDAIETLTINDGTARSVSQSSLSDFMELADIGQMQNLKTLELDFYDPTYSYNGNRQPLKGIDFPVSLENLSMKNIYWEKDTQTNLHEDADIVLTNLKTLELYNSDVKVEGGDSGFNHSTRIELTDKDGVLESCIIERSDVESVKLTNNSEGKNIKDGDEKKRIRFSATDCEKLKSIEFLGEGYAVEGSLDLSNDKELTHIGIHNDDKSCWTVYGEFDMTEASADVILNSCSVLGSDCEQTVIDYDFVNGRSLNVQTLNTVFDQDNKLIIKREPEDEAGKVYLTCDKDSWVYNNYLLKDGFVIEEKSSFPTIAVFSSGQKIRTSGAGNSDDASIYTEDSERWVDRWDLVMAPGGYSNNFGNLTFYVVDRDDDGTGKTHEKLRKVGYSGDNEFVYVEWDQQNAEDSIIILPTEKVGNEYILTGTRLSSTGTPGEVELKLYVYNTESGNKVKTYIGYQNIKIFRMPNSVELVSDGTKRGSGTKDDPFILDKKSNEELMLKARLMVNGDVESGDYALRNIYWRIKEYDEEPKYTSDKDGYSLYTLDSATKAGISVVRGELEPGETETEYDERIDTSDETYYSHRRFAFNTEGTKYKIVAQSPLKNYEKDTNGEVILSEVYVEISDKPITIDISNDNSLIHGKNGRDETTVTVNNVDDTDIVNVSIKNPEWYEDCFSVVRDSSSTNSKEVWKLKINGSDNSKIKEVIENKENITLLIRVDDKKIERVIKLESVFQDNGTETFWCSKIEDLTYTGKAIKPKLNIYNGKLCLSEGKDYTLSYGNNVNVSQNAVNAKGKRIGPYVTIKGKGNYSDKQTYYFSIVPRSIENTAKVEDIIVAKTGKNIKIAPTVTLDGKKLKQGTDYVVSTTEDVNDAIVSLKDPQDIPLYVVGKGNYSGAVKFGFTITESVLAGKVTISKIANQVYNDGAEIKPEIKITYKKKDVTDCFDIEYENNTEIGTATVVATSKKTSDEKDFIGEAGYSFKGIKKATFKINGQKITDTKLGITGKEKMPIFIYSGKKNKPKVNLYNKTGTEQLEEGKDYSISYSNNINVGTATALVTGKGKYSGTKKITFKISKYDAGKDTANIITVNNNNPICVDYEKGGVTPKPTISMNGAVLTEKKDYTLSYANNKSFADAGAVNAKGKSIAPTVVITFKGNFSGKKSVPFTITAKNIAAGKITLADKAVSTKKNAWKQNTAVIVDTNGKKLAAGTDYNKAFEYYTDQECTSAITDEVLDADTTVYVKVTGIKNYEGSYIVGNYRVSNTNISTVKATIANQTYTGEQVCPPVDQITVTVGSSKNQNTLRPDVDYEVVEGSYTNNTNKGTASVTIRGKGNYYGTKVVKYKICANKIHWWDW